MILVGISFFISDDAEITSLSKEWNRFINEAGTIKNKTVPECFYQFSIGPTIRNLGGLYIFTGTEVTEVTDLNPLFCG
jgi:hypothetical protein